MECHLRRSLEREAHTLWVPFGETQCLSRYTLCRAFHSHELVHAGIGQNQRYGPDDVFVEKTSLLAIWTADIFSVEVDIYRFGKRYALTLGNSHLLPGLRTTLRVQGPQSPSPPHFPHIVWTIGARIMGSLGTGLIGIQP